jgi:MFS family permease
MSRSTIRLVLLISLCHALVHVYELSFASVEQLVADDFGVDTGVTGWLGFGVRLPFGLFALAAGWLADRFGAKRLLLTYLFGASAAVLLAWLAPGLGPLFVVMFSLGTFASIYHPAGVALISHETTPENRPMALGYHGIFGSAGIAGGPFLAGLVLATGATWRQYYLVLTLPGLLLGLLLFFRLHDVRNGTDEPAAPPPPGDDESHWDCYFLLMTAATLSGFVYAAVMTFLPRYLTEAGVPVSTGNLLTGAVLVLGILGQYAAGRSARPNTLEPMMTFVFLATAPSLLWMGLATGWMRVAAAALFAPLFFMHQPLFNSLVAKYVPRRRRGLAYGLSFTIGFGIGSTGSAFAGKMESTMGEHGTLLNYGTLAVLTLVVSAICLVLWRRHRAKPPAGPLPPAPWDDAPASA